jgi:putative membrane protein
MSLAASPHYKQGTTMRIASSSLIAVVLLAAAGVASADETFLSKAVQTSMAEVQLGKLAQKNAESTGVNALGVRLERDHARIGKLLAAVSQSKGVLVPASVDTTAQARIDSLSAKKGVDFDTAYSAQMVSDHEKAIVLFSAAADGSDPEIARVAKIVLPTLREDQRLAASFEKLSEGSATLPAVARRD